MDIQIRQLCKRFGNTAALDHVDLELCRGELIALLGPSGSGKTTLLRAIAGLEQPDRGDILFDGVDTAGLPVQRRRVGFVFQHYALFRHMSVLDNVAFGLRCKPRRERLPADAIRQRALDLLDTVQLSGLAERYPHQLSGGQRQRVALARAMAIDPTLLLLDEPFGALDAKVRTELRAWLRRLHDETGYTTLFVTHDQDEAMELADRIVVFNQGRIAQVGTPAEIYEQPESVFVFNFLGRGHALQGAFHGDHFTPAGSTLKLPVEHAAGPGQLHVRPHDYVLAPVGAALSAHVVASHRLAGRLTLQVLIDEQPAAIEIDLPYDPDFPMPQSGDRIALRPRRYHALKN